MLGDVLQTSEKLLSADAVREIIFLDYPQELSLCTNVVESRIFAAIAKGVQISEVVMPSVSHLFSNMIDRTFRGKSGRIGSD